MLRTLRTAGLLLASLFVALGCGKGGCDRGGEPPGRVLLIGIDGASPRVVGSMIEGGRLPNLAEIATRGVSGRLKSVRPLLSPRIWNTIATGYGAPRHGIRGFVVDPNAERKELYASTDRLVPALWNIVSGAGHSVGVVNWWTTYPPEKIDGAMVSDHFFPEQISLIKKKFDTEQGEVSALVHPVEFEARARELLEGGLTVSDPLEGDRVLPHWLDIDLLRRQFETDKQITQVALGVEEEFHPDVMMVLLPGIDRVSHRLWGMLEPPDKYPPELRPNDEERSGGARALHDYYAFTDELIGRLRESYGPDDLVLVVSDHGFEAGVPWGQLTGTHETGASLDGVIFAAGAGIAPGDEAAVASVFQIAPIVLGWLGVPAASTMARLPDFVSLDLPPSVPNYDGLEIERVEGVDSGHEEKIVEHLRALGYLEDGDDEQGDGEAAVAPEP